MIYKVDYIDCDYDFFPEYFLADVIENEDSTTFYGIKSKGKAIEDKALADFAHHLINCLLKTNKSLGTESSYYPLNIDVEENLFSINGSTYSVIKDINYSTRNYLEIPSVMVDMNKNIFRVTSIGLYYSKSSVEY